MTTGPESVPYTQFILSKNSIAYSHVAIATMVAIVTMVTIVTRGTIVERKG